MFRGILTILFLVGSFIIPLFAQESEDIAEFFTRGKECYEKRDLQNAAVELENVLLLDPGHLDAKILLIKVYGDLKEIKKAQDLLKAALAQDPDNAELKSLEKLFGGEKPKVKKKEGDLVLHETLTLLGNKTPPRPLGLVIPQNKIKSPKPDFVASQSIAFPQEEPKASESIQVDEKKEEGPLYEVFDIWALEGLNSGLEKYFEVVGADKSLGVLDDRNLLRDGLNFFKPRFEANPQDEENRYFYGMITFFNGEIEQARQILDPILNGEKMKSPGGKLVLAEFERLQKEEDARQLAKKKEEEAREAARRAEEEAKAAAAAAAAAAVAQAASGTADSSGTVPLPAAGTPEATDLEGYDLYKKGQLDEAIEKFKQAIAGKATEPQFFYHLGLAYTDKALGGKLEAFDKAIEAFNNVMRLTPGTKLARDAEIMIRDLSAAKNSVKP